MAKHKAVMLKFLHHFKSQALPFSVRFQNGPQHFANAFATLMTGTAFFLKNSKGAVEEYFIFVI
jgi:hypothetical protein